MIPVGQKLTLSDRISYFRHQPLDKVQIMDSGQADTQYLPGFN
jgi:hypothetical protein